MESSGLPTPIVCLSLPVASGSSGVRLGPRRARSSSCHSRAQLTDYPDDIADGDAGGPYLCGEGYRSRELAAMDGEPGDSGRGRQHRGLYERLQPLAEQDDPEQDADERVDVVPQAALHDPGMGHGEDVDEPVDRDEH